MPEASRPSKCGQQRQAVRSRGLARIALSEYDPRVRLLQRKSKKRRLHGLSRLSKSRKSTPSTSTGRALSQCSGLLKLGSSPAASPDRCETFEGDSDPAAGDYQGDAKSASIAAASIRAKVSRDALMRALDTR